MSERDIFIAALEKPPHERVAYLDAACAGNPELRLRIDILLRVHDQAGSALDKPIVAQIAAAAAGTADTTTTADDAGEVDLSYAADAEIDDEEVDAGPPLDFLAPPEKPGQLGKLGPYEVLEVVGRGGMGVVLKAFDPALHRVVAIKVMAPHLAANSAARKRFEREARAIAAVRNDHVVAIHDIEADSNPPYLVMDFIGGLSLQQRLEREGPLELKEIVRIAHQAARGLAAAHAVGIVHRDVKPANILLENGVERVKLTDFGLARTADDASLTQSGTVAGTPSYMSPEQADGREVDARSDLFSLGSVVYAMATGHPPFRAGSVAAVLKRVVVDTPRPIREVNPDLPDWLDSLVAKLHAKRPDDRFQTAAEVADVLEQYLAHLQQPKAVAAPVFLPPPAPSSAPPVPTPTPVTPDPWTHITSLIWLVVPLLILGRNWFGRDWSLYPTLAWGGCIVLVVAVAFLILRRTVFRRTAASSLRWGKVFSLLVPLLIIAPTLFYVVQPWRFLDYGPDSPGFRGSLLSVKWYDPDRDLVVKTVRDGQEEILAADQRPINGPLSASRHMPPGPCTVRVSRGTQTIAERQVTVGSDRITELELPHFPPGSPNEWTSLFDEQGRASFTGVSRDARWTAEADVLVGRGGTARLKGDYDNFHLWAEVQINAEGDAGLVVRTAGDTGTGCEVTISGRQSGPPNGSLTIRDEGPAMTPAAKRLGRPGDWIPVEMIARGGLVVSRVNGQIAAQRLVGPAGPRRGAVLVRAGPSTEVKFRQLRIKLLPAVDALPSLDTPVPAAVAKWHQEQWARHLKREVVETDGVGIKLVLVPPMAFDIGSRDDQYATLNEEWQGLQRQAPTPNPWRTWEFLGVFTERPQRRVRLTRPIQVSAHEITVAQFREFVTATGYKTEAETTGRGGFAWDKVGAWRQHADVTWSNPGRTWKPSDDSPVVQVTRTDAEQYCAWLGRKEGRVYRLPTPEEWEGTCRAGTATRYSFGDAAADLGRHGWSVESGVDGPQPVGRKVPNAWGLFDMHGNVQEWCAPGYQGEHFSVPASIDPPLPTTVPREPGPMRGGGWSNHAFLCRSAARLAAPPGSANDHTGFRVVCEVAVDSAAASGVLVRAFPPTTATVTGLPVVQPNADGWRVATTQGGRVELFEATNLSDADGTLVFRARVRGVAVEGGVRLHLRCRIAGKDVEAYTPIKLVGADEWATVEVPVALLAGKVERATLAVVLDGKGSLAIRDVELRHAAKR